LRGADDKPKGTDPRGDKPTAREQRGSVDGPVVDDSALLALDQMASGRDQTASDRDQTSSDGDQTASDRDQTSSDGDQTTSDRDQTSSDGDQTTSDRDQTSSDRDQAASDEDQIASDRESAGGVDQRSRDLGSVHREHAANLRSKQARDRERTAVSREITADERGQTASTRDHTAEARDAGARARGRQVDLPESARREEQALRAANDRRQAAADRARAANDRNRAAEERTCSAHERALAAQDRAQAAADREESETDELTHVRRRGTGMRQLQQEIDRARRTSTELVVAFVDVNGLKAVNDTEGHLAGDSLLATVADSLRTCLRSYDLIMRYGGDEFVCALPNADTADVRRRFADVSSALAAGATKGSITVGFAEFGPNDTAEDLIRRADVDLLARREHR
jgi:diguanylate cyclase (GGDEF)-like protein